MKYCSHTVAIITAGLLVACSDDASNQNNTDAQNTANESASRIEKAQETAAKVAEKAQQIAEELKLDTSSLSAFKESLNDMKASLNADQTNKLNDALTKLAKDSAGDKQGLINAAKSMTSGRSAEETLYDTMADKLDGMTFEDILNLAN